MHRGGVKINKPLLFFRRGCNKKQRHRAVDPGCPETYRTPSSNIMVIQGYPELSLSISKMEYGLEWDSPTLIIQDPDKEP